MTIKANFHINFILFSSFQTKRDVYLYDIQKNIWNPVASMDKTRLDHSCAAITTSSSSGNVVLVCGGRDRPDCEIYDAAKNSWTNGPSLPSALVGSAMVTAAPNSNYDAFILGGYYDVSWSNKIYGMKVLTAVTLVGTLGKARGCHIAFIGINGLCQWLIKFLIKQ